MGTIPRKAGGMSKNLIDCDGWLMTERHAQVLIAMHGDNAAKFYHLRREAGRLVDVDPILAKHYERAADMELSQMESRMTDYERETLAENLAMIGNKV